MYFEMYFLEPVPHQNGGALWEEALPRRFFWFGSALLRTRRGLPQSCSGLARLTRQGGFAPILVAVMEGIAVLQMK